MDNVGSSKLLKQCIYSETNHYINESNIKRETTKLDDELWKSFLQKQYCFAYIYFYYTIPLDIIMARNEKNLLFEKGSFRVIAYNASSKFYS